MSYYKQIDGVQYDRALIEAAEKAVAGRGDGRISRADAEALLPFVTDGGAITAAEQATLVYLRDNFTWTDKAAAWFKDAIAKWEAGDRTAPAAPTPAPAAASGEPAVIIRLGSRFRGARYIPADAAAQARGCAVVILANYPSSTKLSAVWEKTEPQKSQDLPKEVELALVHGGSDAVQANLWRVQNVIGTRSGRVSWQSGFTNIPAAALISTLESMGFQVTDAETLF